MMKFRKIFAALAGGVFVVTTALGIAACGGNGSKHTLKYVPERDSTCTAEGVKEHFECTDEGCGKYFADMEFQEEIAPESLVIAKKAHKTKLVPETEADCTHEGAAAHYACETCGGKFTDENATQAFTGEVTPKTAHKMTFVPTDPATKEEKGFKEHYECEYEPDVYYADKYGDVKLEAKDLELDTVEEMIDGVADPTFYDTENPYFVGADPVSGGLGFVLNARLAERGLYIHLRINHNLSAEEHAALLRGMVSLAIDINDGASLYMPGNQGFMMSNRMIVEAYLDGNDTGYPCYDSRHIDCAAGNKTNYTTSWEAMFSYESLSTVNNGVFKNAFEVVDGQTKLKKDFSVFINAIGAFSQDAKNSERFTSDGVSVCSDQEGVWWFWYKQDYGDWYTDQKMYRVSQKGFETSFTRFSDEVTVNTVKSEHNTITTEFSNVTYGDDVTFEATADEGYRIAGINVNGKDYPVRARGGKYICSVNTGEILAWNRTEVTAFAHAVVDDGSVIDDPTLLYEGFSSQMLFGENFNVFGQGSQLNRGGYEFATGKDAMILSKKNDFTDFTLDIKYDLNENAKGAVFGANGEVRGDSAEIGILLRAKGTGTDSNVTNGLNGMLVGLEYVDDTLVVSYGYYFDGKFEKAGSWWAEWQKGFSSRYVRLVVKGSLVSVIINDWQAYTFFNKFTSEGAVGVLSKGYGLRVDDFSVTEAPESIYASVTREGWKANKTIETGKAFTNGEWHSFDLAMPENAKDIKNMWLFRRADGGKGQTATVELGGERIDGWKYTQGSFVSRNTDCSGDLALPLPESGWKGKSTLSFKITSTTAGMFDADYYWLVYETANGVFVADSLDVGSAHDEAAHNFRTSATVNWQSFYARKFLTRDFEIVSAKPGERLSYVAAPRISRTEESMNISRGDANSVTIDLKEYVNLLPTGFLTDTLWLFDGMEATDGVVTVKESGKHSVAVIVNPLSFNQYSEKGALGFDPVYKIYEMEITLSTPAVTETNKFDKATVADKLLGGWLGSLVGTYLGLDTEGQFLDEPNPDTEVRWNLGCGYTSDDDSNVELMFLHMMEIYGTDNVAFEDMVEEWITHCQNYVWCANEQARNNMIAGMSPALTGKANVNWGYNAIDAQIECEIFGMISPGMLRSAYDRAKFWLTPVGDTVALENAAYYAMMCSQAYIDSDIETILKKVSAASLEFSEGASAETVSIVSYVYNEYLKVKEDYENGNREAWRTVRAKICDKYYTNYHNKMSVAAQINFASTIMALIFGGDDYEEVCRIAALSGWDNDCNAATACTIWGMMYGYENYPQRLKDVMGDGLDIIYMNSRRPGLTSDTFGNIVKRTMTQAENIILANGGQVSSTQYTVKDAPFTHKTYPTVEYVRRISPMNDAVAKNGFHKFYDEDVYGKTGLAATQAGATLEYTFTGPYIQIYGMLCEDGGDVEIFVDGNSYGTRTLKCDFAIGINYAEIRTVHGQTIAKIRNLSNGTHTLKIVTKNVKQVVIEYFEHETTEDDYYNTVTPETNVARIKTAKAICSVTPAMLESHPGGGGSHDLNVIRDGNIMPNLEATKTQYDTYLGAGGANRVVDDQDWFGIDFGTRRLKFGKIVFVEGGHWANGGWFKNAVLNETLYVEVLVNGEWTKVEVTCDKEYPYADTQAEHLPYVDSYTFTLKTPVEGTAIRLVGTVGGSERFTSCSEFEVYVAE